MHLLKFLVLVFGFCLVFAKAESEMKDEEAFVLDELDNNASEDWSPNLKEDPKADTEDSKMMPEEDSKEEDSQKRHHSTYPIYMTMRVPTNHHFRFFHASYCFRRRCYVPGMRQGFLSWRVAYESGYVVINNWLYYFWNCSGPKYFYGHRPAPQTINPTPASRVPVSPSVRFG